mgnify:CR=1 FL=1
MRIGVPLAVIPEELLARLDLPGRPREARTGSRVCGKKHARAGNMLLVCVDTRMC